jgi:small conductance mechanosensitive channel
MLDSVLDLVTQITRSSLVGVILQIALIALLAVAASRVVALVSKNTEQRFSAPSVHPEQRARMITLLKTATDVINVSIFASAILIGLSIIGINITPVLAAAGIAGLAVSLGAQTLIKDVLGGLFILWEDQYRVGEKVTIGAVTGDVEKITFRYTSVRDIYGQLWVISNGDVRVVGNQTREWARVFIDVNLAYSADVHKAVKVLEGAMAQAANDPEIKADLLEPLEILGWDQFNDWAVCVRLLAKVTPGAQWLVSRVLRRHAMDALSDAGVAIESRTQLQLRPDPSGARA